MIGELKPYADYADSGQDWLGSIPAHWGQLRAKRLFREVEERSTTGKEELLSVSHITGVTPRRLKTVTMFMAESNVGHKVCRPGDLVINTLWAWMGALGVTRHTGLVSPAYGVYRPINGSGILPSYADHLLRTPLYAAEYQRRSTGVNSSRLRLYPEQFLRVPVLVPPFAEQAAIVRFLEWANGRLERTIRVKRKVIALLTEQKQAVIHRAVTRGFDSAALLKPSGVNWLGEIPRHWEVRKLKFLVHAVGGMTPNKSVTRFWNGLVPWVSPKDMKVREIVDSRDHITDAALRATNVALIPPPAVLIVVRGMILARTFPTAVTTVPVTVNQDMKALVPKPGLNASFLVSLLTGIQREMLSLVEEAGHGTRCLRTDSWANFSVPLPPIREQNEINETLNSRLAGVNTTISRLQGEIELLREYRARLVADVVTGKLDVRQAAVRVPDEAVPDTVDELPDEIDEAELADEEAAA